MINNGGGGLDLSARPTWMASCSSLITKSKLAILMEQKSFLASIFGRMLPLFSILFNTFIVSTSGCCFRIIIVLSYCVQFLFPTWDFCRYLSKHDNFNITH